MLRVARWKPILTLVALVALSASPLLAQSPPATATATINGKSLAVRYSAPSVRGRQIFGAGGLLSKDPTYPAWRAGANAATTFTTDADLVVGGLAGPEGHLHALRVGAEPERVGPHHQQADRAVGPHATTRSRISGA